MELERQGNRLAAVQTRLAGAVERRAAFQLDGCVTAGSWLRWRARLDPGAAQRRVLAARRLHHFDRLARSFAAGDVSAAHVEVMTRAAIPGRLDALSRLEEQLVDIARDDEPRTLRRAVARVRDAVDPDGVDRPDAYAADVHRELFLTPTFDGLVDVRGVLDQVTGETLLTAIDALDRPDPVNTPDGDRRTPAQRRVDALRRVAEAALASPDLPSVHGAAPRIVLTVDLMTLLGRDHQATRRPRLRHTGEISPGAARCLARDASVVPVLTMGPWRPVNVGRAHRTLPPWLRDVLAAVHRHCRGPGPGCDRPITWTQAHHASKDWPAGADTDVNDTVPACHGHHDLATKHGWKVSLDPDTGTWHGPDGQTIDTRAPPP